MAPRSLLVALALLLGCPAANDDDSAVEPAPEFDRSTTDSVLDALEDALPDEPAFGCTIALARGDGALWSAAAGLDGPDGDPLAPDDLFNVASISKTHTAGLVLELADDGLLALDDTLEEHLPGVHGRGDEITLRMLLDHTASIPGVLGLPEPQADPTRAWTEDELFGLVADEPLLAEPGAAHNYSNTHYMLLARVAQAAAGAPWRQLMEERLFAPLGLADTSVPPLGADWPEDLVPAWLGQGPYPAAYRTHPQSIGAAGNVIATAADVALWGQARFGGALHSAEMNEAQLEGPSLGGGIRYGLGAMILDTDDGDDIGHNGALGGFATWVGHRPDADVTLALLCNAWGALTPAGVGYPLPLAQDELWEAFDP